MLAVAQDRRNFDTPDTNTQFKFRAPATAELWNLRRAELRRQILVAAGLLPMPERRPMRRETFGRKEFPDFAVEKVLLETWPDYWLGGNLYRPARRTGTFPGVASPHGHWKGGRLEDTGENSVRARCINLARQGYVVFAYDMVGYNDTQQTPHDFGGRQEQLWSFSPLGLQLWNSIRVLDFLQSLPDVNANLLAATGASGGGTQTFLLAAVDERVRVSAPVNMISANMQGGDPCEDAPGLRLGTYNVEIAALAAPRPMLMVSASGDWTRETPHREFPDVQRIYRLLGVPERVENAHFDADHNYNRRSREAVYRFFAKWLYGGRALAPPQDRPIPGLAREDLLALAGRQRPAGAVDYPALFARWQAEANRQTGENQDPVAARERLRSALGVEWPETVSSERLGERVLLNRTGRGDRVLGAWSGAGDRTALVVHPGGIGAAHKNGAVGDLQARGYRVLSIDVFQTGAARAVRHRDGRYFLTYNLSDDACRVQDIVTALAYLHAERRGDIELHGLEDAGVWTVFAAAVSAVPVRLRADLSGFDGNDEDFLRSFFVPGIQRAGGLSTALRLAGVDSATGGIVASGPGKFLDLRPPRVNPLGN